jgi:predicted ribosomally synthesized peptide with SipW-like signal peptide
VAGAPVKAIYGLCSHPSLAQHTVDSLRRAGVKDDAIVVVAPQPYEEYEFSHRYKKTWLFWIAAGGGALGLVAGLTLAYFTETLWPLVTGGMPIVAWWPNIIIMFELTMLGSIVATVVSLMIMTELPNLRSGVYDPEVSRGKILVAVENPADADVTALEKTFKVSGIEEVKMV